MAFGFPKILSLEEYGRAPVSWLAGWVFMAFSPETEGAEMTNEVTTDLTGRQLCMLSAWLTASYAA